jgi:hypothetical protein
VNERVPAHNVETYWTYVVKTIRSQSVFSSTVEDLKSRPKVNVAPVTPKYVAPVRTTVETANEEGLYRNPADGTLYRLSKPTGAWSFTVSEYSNKATVRRLTTDGEVVKRGTWKKLNAFQSRQLLNKYVDANRPSLRVLAEWKMSDQDKVDYQYGICLFCYRGLTDGESVRRNYGPVCAASMGLPWDNSRKGLRKV